MIGFTQSTSSVVVVVMSLAMAAGCRSFEPRAAVSSLGHPGRIVFEQKGQIWLMEQDGTSKTQITWKGENANPVWSPDGRHIAFVSHRGGDEKEGPWIVSTDGAQEQELARVPARGGSTTSHDELQPVYSPDGTKIFVLGMALSEGNSWWNLGGEGPALIIVDATQQWPWGRTWQRFGWWNPLDGAPFSIEEAVWSPDSKRVAFVSNHGNMSIWVTDTEGGMPRRLTRIDGEPKKIRWSSDGRNIAFVDWDADGWGVFVVQPDGDTWQEFQRVVRCGREPEDFSWSGSGKKIACASATETGSNVTYYLDIVDVSRSKAMQVTMSNYTDQVVWMPDDAKLLLFQRDILLVDSRDPHKVTVLAPNDIGDSLGLSPDGTRILFHQKLIQGAEDTPEMYEEHLKNSGLFVLDLRTGKSTQLLEYEGRTASWCPIRSAEGAR